MKDKYKIIKKKKLNQYNWENKNKNVLNIQGWFDYVF